MTDLLCSARAGLAAALGVPLVCLLAGGCGQLGDPNPAQHARAQVSPSRANAPVADAQSATDGCAAYTSALARCLDAAGVDVAAVDPADNLCTAGTPVAYAGFFDCAAEVLDRANCATAEGFSAAHEALQPCHAAVAVDPW
ncbi:MAG: hypothetical protein JNM72_26270 [Deltaproteobacteria bacterium]|nr:hypothetical protein [Deltaproteobacteria bacterium]